MIQAIFFKDSNDSYRGFSLTGHAGYAEYGQDIICAAVSALSINTVNSIEHFTNDKMEVEMDEESGMLTCNMTGTVSRESQLLMDSLLLGLKGIQEEPSDNTYIQIVIKEV